MLEQQLHFEKDLFFQLNGSDSLFLDHFFYLYSYKWTWLLLYACFLVVFLYKQKWREVLCVLLAVTLVIFLCDQISSGFFKPFFQRLRPTHHPDFKNLVDTVLGYRGGRYGFISSHASNAFGFLTFTALLFRNRIFSCCFALFSIINGYSRIYLGVHFVSDVIVGAMVGIIIGYLVYELYNYVRWKLLKHPKEILRQPVYSAPKAHFLCASYAIMLISLLLFNNQLIKLFYQ
jgi:Membrane-associated phospholipid phosphatase